MLLPYDLGIYVESYSHCCSIETAQEISTQPSIHLCRPVASTRQAKEHLRYLSDFITDLYD